MDRENNINHHFAEMAAEDGCFLVKFQPEESIKKLHGLFGGAH